MIVRYFVGWAEVRSPTYKSLWGECVLNKITNGSMFVLFSLVITACGNFGLNEEQLLQRAKQFLQEKEYIAAAIEARNTLQKNPDNAEARYIMGVIMLD